MKPPTRFCGDELTSYLTFEEKKKERKKSHHNKSLTYYKNMLTRKSLSRVH